MTTPNDAPRSTSELVKRLKCDAAMVREWGSVEDVRVSEDLTEALEARNKELEGALKTTAVYLDALHENIQRNDADMLLDECEAPELVAGKLRAALHPATKTGEE